MKSFSLLVTFALCGQAHWTHAAPDNIEKPVRYDGDQLWNIESNTRSRQTIDALNQLYGGGLPEQIVDSGAAVALERKWPHTFTQ